MRSKQAVPSERTVVPQSAPTLGEKRVYLIHAVEFMPTKEDPSLLLSHKNKNYLESIYG